VWRTWTKLKECFLVRFVGIWDTAGDVERIRTKVTPDYDSLFFRL